MSFLKYILISAACLSISTIAFRLLMRKVTHFRLLRLYLIGSLSLALVLPLVSISIDYSSLFIKEVVSDAGTGYITAGALTTITQPEEKGFLATHRDVLIALYLIIVVVLITRIVFQFLRLIRLYHVSEKRHEGSIILLNYQSIKSPFSFFRWVFLPAELTDKEETEGIILHESIHATQYHSIDNMLIELVTAVMWFNPFAWMMKRSIHLVHEYLADEGALSTGIDRLRYQALLINQVTEERLICLSSSFNHSLIKKRMIMMTKSKNYRAGKLKIFSLLPLSVILFLVVATLNGLFPSEIQARTNEPGTINQSGPLSSDEPVVQDDTTRQRTYHISIVSKDGDAKSEETAVMSISGDTLPDSIIYVVDGAHVKDIKSIEPDSIKSVNIIKSDNIIIIRTKKADGENPGKNIILSQDGGIPSDVIIYINGEESTREALRTLDPDKIVSIDVTKNGDSKGVVKVTTKQ